jgi:hypothetical protein
MVKLPPIAYWIVLIVLTSQSRVLAQNPPQSFSLPASATESFASEITATPSTGFARIQANPGSTAPDGFALFQYRPDGPLVSEATVPTEQLVTNDNFFVEIQGNVNTGIAIANPGPNTAVVSFGFQDPVIRFRGPLVGTGTFTIPPNSHIARFLNEPPFNFPGPYFGRMNVQSSAPVAITNLRGLINERSEFLMTNVLEGQPRREFFGSVVSQPETIAGYIPRFADGGGWNTEIVLENNNNSDSAMVTLDFVASSGDPILVTIKGQTASSFDFIFPRGDILRVATDGAGSSLRAGYVRIIAQAHSTPFNGFALLSFRPSNITESIASVPMVQPRAAFQLPVQEADTSPSFLQSGIAISSASPMASNVSLELINFTGDPTGLTSTIQIPPFGQVARFLREIPGFEAVTKTFRGMLRVTANAPEGVTVIGMRGQLNALSDFVMSMLLPVDPTNVATEQIVPHVDQGAGFQTEVFLSNGQSGTTSSGTLTVVPDSGSALSLISTQ